MEQPPTAVDVRTFPPCGRSFVQLYRELGYTGELSEELFDYLFGLPSLRIQAFLEWFLSSIRPRQSIKKVFGKNDYGIFRELLDRNNGELLHGDALLREEATCRDEIIEKDESLDVLLTTNDELSIEVEELERKLKIAQDKNERLAKMVQTKTQEVEIQSKNLRQVDGISYFRELLHQERESDKKIGPELDDWLLHLSTPHESNTTTTKGYKDFLFQQRLTGLREKERKVLQEIMQLIPSKISKSFLNNPNQNPTNRKDTGLIPRVTGLDDGQEEVIWFHETDPSRLELSAKDACIYNQCSVELARLEKAFIVGEKDFFQAKFLEECVESQFKSLNFSYDILYQKYELMNQEFLEIQHKKFQDQIHFIKNQINFYLNEKIEKILQELGFFHSTMILQGNYQQKLWRQEKKFHQMIQILKKLFQQTSRLQLVHFIFEKEWEEVNQIQQLIQQQLLDPLESDEKTIQARLFAYEQYQNHLLLNTGKTSIFSTSTNTIKLARERLSVKYSDPITHAIYEYLQTKQEKQQKQQKQKKNVLTFDEIISQIEEIFYAKKHQKHEKHQKYQKYQKNVFFLQKSDVLVQTRKNHFLQLRKELFGDENSFVPILLPEKIDFFVKKVQQKKQKNEQIFYQLLENYQQKKRKMMFCPDFLRFDQEKQNNYLQIQTKQNK